MPPLLESEISEIFDRLDKNHSGFIDYSCIAASI
jgi:Ca2+-binding EF-hand superfamily protein